MKKSKRHIIQHRKKAK